MSKSIKHHAADTSKKLSESRVAREIRAHHEWVNEVAHYIRKGRPTSRSRRRANQNVFLPGIAIQQNLKGGEQCHVKRGVVIFSESLELLSQANVELEVVR